MSFHLHVGLEVDLYSFLRITVYQQLSNCLSVTVYQFASESFMKLYS